MELIARSPSTPVAALQPMLDVDPRTFQLNFNQKPFVMKHRLADHPLFTPERLLDLARALPPEHLEVNAANVPTNLVEPNRLDGRIGPLEALQRVAELKVWVGLKRIQQVPEYRELVDAFLDELEPLIRPLELGSYNREGFIFISSPGAVVPYHFDPEHSFLAQIRGRKVFTAFDKHDRSILGEEAIERFYAGGSRKLPFRDDYSGKAQVFTLEPGDVLHVPVSAPHHVRNLDEVNVSLSITFETPLGERRRLVYKLNHNLRKAGLTPTPYGESPLADSLKCGVALAGKALRPSSSTFKSLWSPTAKQVPDRSAKE